MYETYFDIQMVSEKNYKAKFEQLLQLLKLSTFHAVEALGLMLKYYLKRLVINKIEETCKIYSICLHLTLNEFPKN